MFGFRQTAGGIVIDGRQVGETHQCVHCGNHWEVKRGSGIARGFCTRCKGTLCGAPYCMKYDIPFEFRIDYTEALAANDEKKVHELKALFPEIKTI